MSTNLGECTGRHALDKVCQLSFNELHIKVGGVPIRYNDTVATYALVTDEKLNKETRREASAFIRGVVATVKSY